MAWSFLEKKYQWPPLIVRGALARQSSLAVAYKRWDQNPSAWIEDHTVIGLQLDGMAEMGCICAHDDRAADITKAFGNVTTSALEPINDPIFRPGPRTGDDI
jgi:hypothetical protein